MAEENKNKRTIDYTAFDFDELRAEMIQNIIETGTFKDIDYTSSNIRTLIDMWSYLAANMGYYINSAANEVFVPTAKRYKNLNKIGQLLNYDARGVRSSTLDVIGALNPEYVLGKETEYVEIPSYSIFPSTKPTQDNENFIFTNINPIVYIVKSFGTRILDSNDIYYKGFSIGGGLTKPAAFFTTVNGVGLDATEFTLPLKLTKKLSIIQRNDSNNFRPLDTTNFPVSDSSDNQSVGQPFSKTIKTIEFGGSMSVNTIYYLILTYDVATSSPYMRIEENEQVALEKEDDIICTLILEPTDSSETFYTLRVNELLTNKRFYIGNIGIQNLESCSLEFDRIPGRTNSIEKIKLVVNKTGDKQPLSVLVNGKTFTFSSGEIVSQKFSPNFWDTGVEEYNVNLVITDENDTTNNFGAKLEVTSNDPVSNQVTIAKINTRFVDPFTGTRTLVAPRGKKFGDFQVVRSSPIKMSEQKAGSVFFLSGETKQRVVFNKKFDVTQNDSLDYHISLSSDKNIRKWYANKSEDGFDIYVEPDTNFEGNISWVVTRIIGENIRQIEVTFDTPITPAIDVNGEFSNYMVQLTPDQNVEVWYEDLSENGFKIRTEREFNGKVSWSVYNYFSGEEVPSETESAYRQRGRVKLTPENAESGVPVELETQIPDSTYAIQLIANKNVTVWYSDKTQTGFTVRCESSTDAEIIVDWYVDSSSGYVNQQHGEISFEGQTTFDDTIPGFRFVHIPETFQINNLYQGQVKFTYINANNIIDTNNNGLSVEIDPTRFYEEDLRFIVSNKKISDNTLRVFVKNEQGNWDEWERVGPQFDVSANPGEKVFRARTNPDRKLTFEFGDGINWGTSVVNKEMIILGLESVGSEGNITRNTLDNSVIISRYIIGNEKTNIEFEQNLVSLIGLKSQLYFQNGQVVTDLIDSERTRLNQKDLVIIQNKNAKGGQNVETVDEIRKNVTNNFSRQSRNVSLNDYKTFAEEFFNDYIIKANVLSFEEAKNAGIIPEEDLAKYWYNHIFLIGLNKDGSNVIPKNLRDSMIETLNSSNFKMIGMEHEIIAAKWVPIDVVIKYKKSNFGSYEVIETEMRKNIKEYFSANNHSLGSTIRHSELMKLLNIENIETIEVMINRDADNKFNANDYNPIVRPSEVSEKVAVRNKLMELLAKDSSLVKIFQPLFETVKDDGSSQWNYSLDLTVNKDEFPKLGDIIIKREG